MFKWDPKKQEMIRDGSVQDAAIQTEPLRQAEHYRAEFRGTPKYLRKPVFEVQEDISDSQSNYSYSHEAPPQENKLVPQTGRRYQTSEHPSNLQITQGEELPAKKMPSVFTIFRNKFSQKWLATWSPDGTKQEKESEVLLEPSSNQNPEQPSEQVYQNKEITQEELKSILSEASQKNFPIHVEQLFQSVSDQTQWIGKHVTIQETTGTGKQIEHTFLCYSVPQPNFQQSSELESSSYYPPILIDRTLDPQIEREDTLSHSSQSSRRISYA